MLLRSFRGLKHRRFFMMTSHIHLDVSPPAYTGSRDVLDKTIFKKTIPVLAARVPAAKIHVLLKAEEMKSVLLDLPKIRTVVLNSSDPHDDNRLVLLRISDKVNLPQGAQSFLDIEEADNLITYNIKLDYDYWTADEILGVFLPEELRHGSPTGFAMTGHIAHVNLNDEYLPYKHIIGQLILEKNKRVKTVVNKLKTIDNQFRFFKMELIAGEPNYLVEHFESDCRFTFDFTQVYWNSRLHTEHDRLVQLFKPEEVIADVFAGVGPFAVPAAKKGCAVLANDLNPNSAKYLSQNIPNNRVSDLIRVSCQDGHNFIRNVIAQLYDNPFPPYTGPKPSRLQEDKERRRLQKLVLEGLVVTEYTPDMSKARKHISHFVMNLPDSAIEFLGAFRGILHDKTRNLSGIYENMPMIHCHCFTRELEPEKAEKNIRERASAVLGQPVVDDVSVHFVRSVAPSKEMYCISFRLPRAVAFGPSM